MMDEKFATLTNEELMAVTGGMIMVYAPSIYSPSIVDVYTAYTLIGQYPAGGGVSGNQLVTRLHY